MRQINTIALRVFSKENEDYDQIKASFLKLLPFDLEKEKITLTEKTAEGFQDKKIKVITTLLTKERHVKAILNNLTTKLGDEKSTLLEQLDSRLDENLDFYIRLDKDLLLKEKFVLTDSGNCFHIKLNVAAFPKKREIAVKILKELFK